MQWDPDRVWVLEREAGGTLTLVTLLEHLKANRSAWERGGPGGSALGLFGSLEDGLACRRRLRSVGGMKHAEESGVEQRAERVVRGAAGRPVAAEAAAEGDGAGATGAGSVPGRDAEARDGRGGRLARDG